MHSNLHCYCRFDVRLGNALRYVAEFQRKFRWNVGGFVKEIVVELWRKWPQIYAVRFDGRLGHALRYVAEFLLKCWWNFVGNAIIKLSFWC